MAHGLSRRVFGLSVLAALLPNCRRRHSAVPHGDGAPLEQDAVEIDMGSVLGKLTPLSGVQGSPAPILEGDPDLVASFREAGIQRCRFPQDCFPNTLTLGGVFPVETADADAASSYHFEAIDRHVRAARAAGAQILWQSSYDVGRSDRWKGLNLGGRAPEDLARWTKVVTRCLEHFNAGWSDGFEHSVDAVEFVNEPNGLGGFDGPDAKRLEPAFIAFLDAIERYNQAHTSAPVRAVGPGIPLSFSEWHEFRPRFDQALANLAKLGKRWPVFSFHTYGHDVSPKANQSLARALRELLDRHGMQKTELWNTEWQSGDFLRKHLSIDASKEAAATPKERLVHASGMAAYSIACKIRWQGVVDGSCCYRANRRAFPPDESQRHARAGETAFVRANGTLGSMALQELLMGLVMKATPMRCKTELEDDGLLSVAGVRSEDGTRLSVLASNLGLRRRNLDIRVRGQRRAALGKARVVVLDERENPSAANRPGATLKGGDLVIEANMAPLTSFWILLES
jgi:hypothetical protein